MSHTPAPWKAMRMNKTLIISTDENEIATIKASGYNSVLDSGTRSANAILISAAPEMIDMLEHVLANWFAPEIDTGIGSIQDSDEIDKLANLIKKAKGE